MSVKPVYLNCRSLRDIINISERSGSSLDFACHQEETNRQHCKHRHAAGQRFYIITPALIGNQSGICAYWPEAEGYTVRKTLARL